MSSPFFFPQRLFKLTFRCNNAPFVCLGAELVHCPWCRCSMVLSIVEMMCVDCSMRFMGRLYPGNIWKELIPVLSLVRTCDKDFDDFAYEHSDTCKSHTQMTENRQTFNVSDTGGTSYFDIGCCLTIFNTYGEFTDPFKCFQESFFVEDNLWVEFVQSDSLSNCWVDVGAGSKLVQLPFSDFQRISRYFTVKAILVFLIVNCAT